MATTIVTKSGSGAPTASDLVAGELAVDLTNKRLYTEDSGGTVLEVGSNPYNFTANHDGSAKLATTATGIDVTGTVTADGVQSTDGDIKVTTSTSFVGFNSQRAGVPNTGGYQLGRLNFDAYSTGTTFVSGASIQSYSDGAAWTSSSTPAYLSFQTTPSASTSLKERLSIAANGDISFYEDTGTTPKFFWDAAAESLGIGTSSPNLNGFGTGTNGLEIADATLAGIRLNGNAADSMYLISGADKHWVYGRGAVPMTFSTNGAEAMRLDTSGNLLVGKTSTSSGVVGHRFNPNGSQESTTNGGLVAYFNRQTSDGEIVRFDKDGAAVGSIGTDASGNLQTLSSTANYRFGDSNTTRWSVDATRMYPLTDNTYDIGLAGNRVKDLYLSGHANFATAYASTGIYLGAYATPNLLDDYEEGTWTPAAGANLSIVGTPTYTGQYTKIGNTVTAWGSIAATTSVSYTAGGQLFSGLPFTAQGITAVGTVINNAFTVSSSIATLPTTNFCYGAEAISATLAISFQVIYHI